MSITYESAKEAITFIKNLCEKLRLDPNIDLLKTMTFQEVANLHISLLRLDTFIENNGTPKQISQIEN